RIPGRGKGHRGVPRLPKHMIPPGKLTASVQSILGPTETPAGAHDEVDPTPRSRHRALGTLRHSGEVVHVSSKTLRFQGHYVRWNSFAAEAALRWKCRTLRGSLQGTNGWRCTACPDTAR